MQCKIFSNQDSEVLEREVNSFLEANKKACIFNRIIQSQAKGVCTISIFYTRTQRTEVEVRRKSTESADKPRSSGAGRVRAK